MNPGKISVIIPTYNRADLLPRALESVLQQTLPPDEILVVDDGSTDTTPQVIKPYLQRGIRYLPKPNGGPSSARNLGIQSAQGEFVGFLDSDDEYYPELLSATMAMLKKYPSAGVAYTDTAWVCENKIVEPSMNWGQRRSAIGPLLGIQRGWSGCLEQKRFRQAQIQFNLIQMSAVIVRAEVFRKAGLFQTQYDLAEDYEMWMRTSRYYDVCYVDKPLGAIHVHGSNLTVRPELQERFRLCNRSALKSELAWEKDNTLHQVILDHLHRNWESEIAIRLREGNLNQLRRICAQAKADGWQTNEHSMRRLQFTDRYGPSIGLLVTQVLTRLGR